MSQDFRKLKRGLKDISPLFGNPESAVSSFPHALRRESANLDPRLKACGDDEKKSVITCLSCLVPEAPQDSHLLADLLAKKLSLRHGPCSIVSLSASSKEWTHSKTFSFQDQVQDSSRFLFLDFDYESTPQLHKALPLLDQWILYVRPALASLTDAYRMIKAATRIHPLLECFLLVEGAEGDPAASRLYEAFSEHVSRRLGVSLSWLGAFTLPRPLESGAAHLVLDSLIGQTHTAMSSLEKRAIADLVSAGSRI